MIKFEEASINGYPCSICNSSSCKHVHRKACMNCAAHQHPENKVIHVGVDILCHKCVQEIINFVRNHDTFYGVKKNIIGD